MTATIAPYRIDQLHADKLDLWLRTRGGVFVWKNLDLGSIGVGQTSCTPALTEAGVSYPPPHWRFGQKPERHLTSHAEVEVNLIETVDRMPAELTHRGLSAASRKKADRRRAELQAELGGDVWWQVTDEPSASFAFNREAGVLPLVAYLACKAVTP